MTCIWNILFALAAITLNLSFINAQECTLEEALALLSCTTDAITGDKVTCDDLRTALKCYDDLSSSCAAANSTEVAKASAQEAVDEACPTCLSGEMMVQTMSGMKVIKDLEVGDMVSVGSGNFEPIVWNSEHYEGNDVVRATFVTFELSNGEKISMTPSHFAKTIKGEILAGSITVGESMITGKEEAVRVEAIKRTNKQGVYNPQTPSQQIEVNGIIVSTKSKDTPAFMGAIFQVLAFFHSVAPTPVYSTVIESICQYIYEPLMFGQNQWVLPAAVTLLFAGAGVKALKA